MSNYRFGEIKKYNCDGLRYQQYEVYLASQMASQIYQKLCYVVVICICTETTSVFDYQENKYFVLSEILKAEKFVENIKDMKKIQIHNLVKII